MTTRPDTFTLTWRGQTADEALTQIGEWLEALNHSSQAVHYYESALIVNPSYSLAAWRVGQLEMKNKHYQKAIVHFKQAAHLTPDHAPTFYQLSLAYAETGEFMLALEAAENALQNDPNNAGAFLQRLRSLVGLERWQEIKNIEQSLETPVQTPAEVYLWYALATAKLGDTHSALELFAKVSPKIRKQHKEVTQTLDELKAVGPKDAQN